MTCSQCHGLTETSACGSGLNDLLFLLFPAQPIDASSCSYWSRTLTASLMIPKSLSIAINKFDHFQAGVRPL